jgi:uncharacterized membrane protein YcaP (DUF421 family)
VPVTGITLFALGGVAQITRTRAMRPPSSGWGSWALVRIAGKRTLAKLNAFDLVVTIALGSALASTLLPAPPTLTDGLAALAVLVGAQFGVAWLQVRAGWFRRLVKSEPVLLVARGAWREEALRRERISRDEVRAAVRASGHGSMDEVEAVVLETDGSLSVVARSADVRASRSALVGVRGAGEPAS